MFTTTQKESFATALNQAVNITLVDEKIEQKAFELVMEFIDQACDRVLPHLAKDFILKCLHVSQEMPDFYLQAIMARLASRLKQEINIPLIPDHLEDAAINAFVQALCTMLKAGKGFS